MFSKLITFGVLASLFIPGIIIARLPIRFNLKLMLRIYLGYFLAFLILGIVIRLLPGLINPYG